jgi:hypothetical protein
MGGTARADINLGQISVGFEGGVGANEPNPDMYNRSRFTMLGHGHGFLKMPSIDMGVHLLHAWSAEEAVPNYPPRVPAYQAEEFNYVVDGFALGPYGENGVWGAQYPNGSQTVTGIDAKFDLGLFGYFFAGYSHMFLDHALTVGDAIESVHSLGAGEYNIGAVDNFLESPFCSAAYNESCSGGTGNVGSAMLQYELALSNFGLFRGSQDIKLALYGLLSFVSVTDDELIGLEGAILAATAIDPAFDINSIRQDGTIKVKFGGDAEFYANEWLSFGFRADHVRPHSKVQEQVFTILSPRIGVKTAMVTHEEISLQYSRYIYAQRQCDVRDAAGDILAIAAPSADPFPMGAAPGNTGGALYSATNPVNGLPLRAYCTQPAAPGSFPQGFGSHSSNQDAGRRGAPNLLPDENVVKLEASIWW